MARLNGSRDSYKRVRRPFVNPVGFCTAKEAAQLLGVSEVWFQLRYKRRLTPTLFSHRPFYKILDVKALITKS